MYYFCCIRVSNTHKVNPYDIDGGSGGGGGSIKNWLPKAAFGCHAG